MNDQAYYCVIPSALIARTDLSPNAKLLYAVLSSLSKKDGYAWAGNAYLGECLGGVSERSVSRLVCELKKAGLVQYKGRETDPHRQIWLTDLAKNGEVTPPKLASNNTKDNTKDKDKTALSEREPPLGDSPAAPLPFPLETIRQEVADIEAGPLSPLDIGMEAPPPDPVKALEDWFMAEALKHQPDQLFPAGTYGKERKGVQRLVKEAMKRQPDDPKAWLVGYVQAWGRLKRDRKTLIFGQPDTPSKMASGFMDYVIAEMAQAALFEDSPAEEIPW